LKAAPIAVREKTERLFYRPIVLKNVISKMHIVQEEVFGPVAPIIISGDEVEAIKLANDSEYGLINLV
jgi:acyl-CoA reductase-like NAD-dependent aldehyde dehydrogenase